MPEQPAEPEVEHESPPPPPDITVQQSYMNYRGTGGKLPYADWWGIGRPYYYQPELEKTTPRIGTPLPPPKRTDEPVSGTEPEPEPEPEPPAVVEEVVITTPGVAGLEEAEVAVEAGKEVTYLGTKIGTIGKTGEVWTTTGWRAPSPPEVVEAPPEPMPAPEGYEIIVEAEETYYVKDGKYYKQTGQELYSVMEPDRLRIERLYGVTGTEKDITPESVTKEGMQPDEILIAMKDAGADINTLLKYMEEHPESKRGAKAGQLVKGIEAQLGLWDISTHEGYTRFQQLSGEEQFDFLVESRMIPEGSIYISETKFFPGPAVIELKETSPELHEILTTKGYEAYLTAVGEHKLGYEDFQAKLKSGEIVHLHSQTYLTREELERVKIETPELFKILIDPARGYEAYSAEIKRLQATYKTSLAEYEAQQVILSKLSDVIDKEGKIHLQEAFETGLGAVVYEGKRLGLFTEDQIIEAQSGSINQTQLPDGQWIDNEQLDKLKTEAPNIHTALTTVGFAAADKIIQEQKEASATLKGYAEYPFSEALMYEMVKSGDYPTAEVVAIREAGVLGYDIKRYITDHPKVGVSILLTAGFTQAQIDEALKPVEALGVEYTGYIMGQEHGTLMHSGDYIPTMEEYRAMNPDLSYKEYEAQYGDVKTARTEFGGVKWYPGGGSVWIYENIPTTLATEAPARAKPELSKGEFIKSYYKDKDWEVAKYATPQVQEQYSEAVEAWDVYSGAPTVSHGTYVAQYLMAIKDQGIEPTEDMRIKASQSYAQTYGLGTATTSQLTGMVVRAGFPTARALYPEYTISDIKWWEHLITAVNVAAITAPLWLPPVAKVIGKVLPKSSVVTEAQVVNASDDVLRWGNELFKKRGTLAGTQAGTTAHTRALQAANYAEVQYGIASSNLEKLLSRAYMTPNSIPGQLSLQDITNMRFMRLGMEGQGVPLEFYGPAYSGIGPITTSSQELLTFIRNSPSFAKLTPAEQSKLLLSITDYYKALKTGASGYMIAPDEVFYQSTTLIPPPLEPGAIPKLPPTGIMPKVSGADMYPGYFAGGESGLLVAAGGKWAPFAKGTTQTLISPFIIPTGEMTITTASGARVVIRSPGPGTGVTGTSVTPSTRTMTPEQLAKLEGQVEFIPYIIYETSPEGLIVPKIMYYPVVVPLPEISPIVTTTPLIEPTVVPAPATTPTPAVTPTPALTPETPVKTITGPTISPILEPTIAPVVEPALEPALEPAVAPAISTAVITTTTPELLTAIPPPFSPPPSPPLPPIILIPREKGKKKLKVTAKQLAEGVTFRQGLIWIVKLPPLTGVGITNVYTMDAPPPSKVFRADVGLPRETVSGVETGAKPPKGDFTIPWGLFNIHYKDGTLVYLPSGKTPMEVIKEPITPAEKPEADPTVPPLSSDKGPKVPEGLEFEVEKKERLKKPIRRKHPGLRPPKLEPPSLREVQL